MRKIRSDQVGPPPPPSDIVAILVWIMAMLREVAAVVGTRATDGSHVEVGSADRERVLASLRTLLSVVAETHTIAAGATPPASGQDGASDDELTRVTEAVTSAVNDILVEMLRDKAVLLDPWLQRPFVREMLTAGATQTGMMACVKAHTPLAVARGPASIPATLTYFRRMMITDLGLRVSSS